MPVFWDVKGGNCMRVGMGNWEASQGIPNVRSRCGL